MRRFLKIASLLIGTVVALGVAFPVMASGTDRQAAFLSLITPGAGFSAMPIPPAPDYAQNSTWLALPDRDDSSHAVPPGVTDNQATAPADVFFIHPTTLIMASKWNARYDEPGATLVQLEQAVLPAQASAFDGCCRVFAPRYRQASLYALLKLDDDSFKAIDLAYADVRRAFDYYIAHENHGRPFIIAAHSQGSLHASRLVQEFAHSPLKNRLIAAYLIGSSLPASIAKTGIPLCDAPDQTGCAINWNSVNASADNARRLNASPTYINGKYGLMKGHTLACVNPLTWRVDGKNGDAALNLGALTDGKTSAGVGTIVPGLVGASCRDHMLVISLPPKDTNFSNAITKSGDFHVFDYSLFYMNIRQNAAARVVAYLSRHPETGNIGKRK